MGPIILLYTETKQQDIIIIIISVYSPHYVRSTLCQMFHKCWLRNIKIYDKLGLDLLMARLFLSVGRTGTWQGDTCVPSSAYSNQTSQKGTKVLLRRTSILPKVLKWWLNHRQGHEYKSLLDPKTWNSKDCIREDPITISTVKNT